MCKELSGGGNVKIGARGRGCHEGCCAGTCTCTCGGMLITDQNQDDRECENAWVSRSASCAPAWRRPPKARSVGELKMEKAQIRLSSNVHTLRAQTLIFAPLPDFSSSISCAVMPPPVLCSALRSVSSTAAFAPPAFVADWADSTKGTTTSTPSHQHLRCRNRCKASSIPSRSAHHIERCWDCESAQETTYRRLPPEEQQLLRGRELILVDLNLPSIGCRRVLRSGDARFEQHKSDRSNATSRWLDCSETPCIITVEAAERTSARN